MVLSLVVTLLVSFGLPSAPPLGYCGRNIVGYTNEIRQQAGLPKLTVGWRLHRGALAWSRQMRDEAVLRHTPLPVFSENVGYSPDVPTLNQAWYESPGHRALMLDSEFTRIGPGCAYSTGRVWGTVWFR